jgi:minor extracellular serine protease Vpr
MHKYLGKGVRKQENITDMAIAANTANTDQKRENLLNLSLSVSEEERMRSESLETGFDREERTWELIVKYFGDLSGLRERGIRVRELLNGYGILKVPEYLVDFVTNLPEIEYIEKPKRLFFAVNQARAASCLLDVQQGIGGETANSNPLENIFGLK